MLAGRFAAAERKGAALEPPPRATALGSLLAHITGEANPETFQPMNINFGLMPPVGAEQSRPNNKADVRGRDRKLLYTKRAKADFGGWVEVGKGL